MARGATWSEGRPVTAHFVELVTLAGVGGVLEGDDPELGEAVAALTFDELLPGRDL